MIDEWLEGYIDKLCEIVPAYVRPRMVKFRTTRVGWRLALYAAGFKRRVWGALTNIQWMEKEELAPPEPQIQQAADPALDRLDPATRREIEAWNEQQKAWEEKQKKERRKWRTPLQCAKDWWAGRHERERRRDERWDRREAAAEERAQKHMHRMLPLMEAVKRSRFASLLLLTVFAVLGVCAQGGGTMAYLAAACCAMWLAIAMETGYEPVAGGVRQRYLAAMALRTGSFLMALPFYFEGYAGQGVTSNVILQSAMLVLLFAHLAFYLALVAFNARQPLFLRLLSGLVGVIPALTAAAAIALAATQLALPMPAPAAGVIGACGALLAFAADRIATITELGGIRLRYTPLWNGLFLEAGFFMMVLGAWR